MQEVKPVSRKYFMWFYF